MGVPKIIGIVLSVICMINLFFLMSFISLIFFPDVPVEGNFLLRGIVLMVVFGITGLFYNYIMRGDDGYLSNGQITAILMDIGFIILAYIYISLSNEINF